MAKHNLKVGQELWFIHNRYLGSQLKNDGDPESCEIIKIGSKYFTARIGYRDRQFDIETLREKTSNWAIQLYLTSQEILDEKKHRELSAKLQKYFSGYGKIDLTIDQMNKIIEIIGPEKLKRT